MKPLYKSSLAIRTKSPGIARVWIYDSFCANTQLVEACVLNLSQMGELVGKLDEAFIEAHSDVPWKAMRGLRNPLSMTTTASTSGWCGTSLREICLI